MIIIRVLAFVQMFHYPGSLIIKPISQIIYRKLYMRKLLELLRKKNQVLTNDHFGKTKIPYGTCGIREAQRSPQLLTKMRRGWGGNKMKNQLLFFHLSAQGHMPQNYNDGRDTEQTHLWEPGPSSSPTQAGKSECHCSICRHYSVRKSTETKAQGIPHIVHRIGMFYEVSVQV